MQKFNRYLATHIISFTLVTLVALLGIGLFVQLVTEINDLGKGAYHMPQVLWVAMLLMPRQAYEFFPMVGLLSCLLALGTLAARSELIAMQAAGFSKWQITRAVLFTASMIIILVSLLGEALAPSAYQQGNQYKQNAMQGGQAVRTSAGIWFRDGQHFFLVQPGESKTHWESVSWYELDDNFQLQRTGTAASAEFVDGAWQLHEVTESLVLPDGRITSQHTQQKNLQIHLTPNMLTLTEVEPEEMSLWELRELIAYQQGNGLHAAPYQLMFWQRVLQPLASMAMIFLAIPFIFGPLRNVSMGVRIVSGVGVGFAFYFFNRIITPFSLVYQLPAWFAAGLPILLVLGLAYWLLQRT
jgi:lipopolysaccharide export system permease protein